MYFDFLEEHEMLRDAVRGVMKRHDPLALIRADPMLDHAARRAQLQIEAEQGWADVMIDESLGGTGFTIVEAMVIAEQLGRAGNSSAFGARNAAALAVSRFEHEEREPLLSSVARGEICIAWLAAGNPQTHGKNGPAITATPCSGGWRINGTAHLVQDADIADMVLIDALTDEGWLQFLVPVRPDHMAMREVTGLDVSRRFCDVTLDRLEVPQSALISPNGQAKNMMMLQNRILAVLTSADSVGIAERLLDMTVAYTRDRIAFGKPIAAFQAVKHRCADILIQLENARVATWYAAVALRDGRDDVAQATSIAKFHATEAASFVASQALQLHGAIGMTWEHDLHIFYKRAKANELLWGSNASHREQVAQDLAI